MTGTIRESNGDNSEERKRSGSSEPWDERPVADIKDHAAFPGASIESGKNTGKTSEDLDTMRRDICDEENALEDGDLPPLNLSRSQSSSNPKRADLRTLNPPDAEWTKQSEFWKQLDPPSVSKENENIRRNRRDEAAGDEVDAEDGPDDEMSARRVETREEARRDSHRSRKSKSKSDSRNEDVDYMEQLRKAESEETDDSKDSKEFVMGEHEENNFCDHTLSAMEAICGEAAIQSLCGGGSHTNVGGHTQSKPAANENYEQPTKRGSKLSLLNARDETDSVEEHTAIEVEYVEPEDTNHQAPERPDNWSPSRKNAYLAAMARKAKEEFEKSHAREGAAMQPKKKTNPGVAEQSAEDVYNSFTTPEKRKFLRLINSGLTTTESAERVRSERDNAKVEKKASKKGKLFKFWKKGSSKTKTADQNSQEHSGNALDGISLDRNHQGEEKKEDDSRLIRNTQISQDTNSVDEVSASGEASAEASRVITNESHSTGAEQSADSNASPPAAQFLENSDDGAERSSGSLQPRVVSHGSPETGKFEDNIPPAAESQSSEPSSVDKQRDPSRSHSNSFELSNNRNPFEPSDDFIEDDCEVGGRFAKSGINYYDAVRRDLSESEDEADFVNNKSSSAKSRAHWSPRRKPILQSPKFMGFSKLEKGGMSASEDREKTPVVSGIGTPPISDVEGSSVPAHTAPIVTPDSAKQLGRGEMARPEVKTESPVEEEEKMKIADADLAISPATGSQPNRPAPRQSQVEKDSISRERESESESESARLNSSQAEDEALGKIEQELLRPLGKVANPKSTGTVDGAKAMVASQDLSSVSRSRTPAEANDGHKSRNSALISPVATPTRKMDDLDFNMQDYLNSTEVYSASGYVNDNMSVISVKSLSTAETSLQGAGSVYTQSSTLTQSSRKRRPGAAKIRLAKAKEAESQASKKKGWHESIRAAAATTNRVWKPKVGWVDYEEPEDVPADSISTDKIHLNLDIARHAKRDEGSSARDIVTGEPVAAGINEEEALSKNESSVASASNREKERALMNKETLLSSSDKTDTASHDNSSPLCLDDMSVEQSVAYSVEHFVHSVEPVSPARSRRKRNETSPMRAKRATNSPSKRTGWIESMRVATANIGRDGQSWDPMNGWVNTEDASSLAEPVTRAFQSPSETLEQTDLAGRQIKQKPDPEQGGDPAVATSRNGLEPVAKVKTSQGSGDITADPSSQEPTEKRDSAVLDKWSGKGAKFLKPTPPSITDNQVEKVPKGNRNEDDDVPLLDSGAFSEENLNMTATVNVVKQKVNEEDISWFPQSRRGSAHTANTATNEQSRDAADTSIQRSAASSSSKSTRRGYGPVDVDEVEILDIDSDEEQGIVWDGVVFETDSFLQGSTSSMAKTGIQKQNTETVKSGSSVASTSLSSYSKAVPRLSQSKRDTSPIRRRNSAESGRSSWRDGSSPALSNGLHSSSEAKPSNEKDEPSNEELHSSQKAHRMDDTESGSVYEGAPSVDGASSSVKLRAQQWESRAPKEHQTEVENGLLSGETSRLNSATKSYLGKKVQEESDAAARENERLYRNGMAGGRISYIGQNDSLFDFSVNDGAFPTSPSSVSSPPRNRNYAKSAANAESQLGRQPYGQDISSKDAASKDAHSSAPPEGSDFSDGNEINKSFLNRLAGCAAPMLPRRLSDSDATPMAPLAFLRTNPQDGKSASSRFMPQYICGGRPDVIIEEEGETGEPTASNEETNTVGNGKDSTDKQRPTQPQIRDIKTQGSEVRTDTRSVISEDFGAKTAYLEALAMKTAVSKPRRSSDSRRRDRSSSASETTSSTSKSHSREKWREFLEARKAASGASPGKFRSSGSEASVAAESYAAKKVEEMMEMMASRSKSTPRNWRSPDQSDDKHHVVESMLRDSSVSGRSRPTSHDFSTKGSDAAEALAKVRVEAMMQALANTKKGMDEGEI
jgi:hypothetical protein